jgi:hypothetical protein
MLLIIYGFHGNGGTWWRSAHCATSLMVAGTIPDVIEIFH